MNEKSLGGLQRVFEMRIENSLISCNKDESGTLVLSGYGWCELYDHDDKKEKIYRSPGEPNPDEVTIWIHYKGGITDEYFIKIADMHSVLDHHLANENVQKVCIEKSVWG